MREGFEDAAREVVLCIASVVLGALASFAVGVIDWEAVMVLCGTVYLFTAAGCYWLVKRI